jgi:hypothetical protein
MKWNVALSVKSRFPPGVEREGSANIATPNAGSMHTIAVSRYAPRVASGLGLRNERDRMP